MTVYVVGCSYVGMAKATADTFGRQTLVNQQSGCGTGCRERGAVATRAFLKTSETTY